MSDDYVDGTSDADREHFDAVRTFILSYVERNGFSPTVRDITRECGFKSTSTVHQLLYRMKSKGMVDWTPGMARTLRLIEEAA